MNSAERRARMIFHAGNRVVALAVSACLLALFGFGIGGIPALGRALVPGHGAWRSEQQARQTLASWNEQIGVKPAAGWRMVVQWPDAGAGAGVAEGKYPGSQSDDPASPWHLDLLGDWQTGTSLPMPAAGGTAAASPRAISWELRP
jgi:penicillin amidase